MSLPAVVYLFIFSYLPMAGLVIAFQKYTNRDGIFGSPFVGLSNFGFLFSSTDAWIITRNTVLYNLAFITVNMLLALTMAIMLSELHSRWKAKAIQTIYMMPYFLSWTVINIVVYAFLARGSGLVNALLVASGGTVKIDWYQQIRIWPPLLVFLNTWKNAGYQTVLFLAVISSISGDYYEAAMLDGANKFQQAWHITLPHLRFVLGISIILSMGSIFRGDFGLFFTVTRNSGLLYPVTDVIDTYIYRGLMSLSNVSMSAAAGLYQSVVGFILVIIVNSIVRKIDPDSAMF
jgi:putative aldouronate transport system permease protein